MGIKEKLNFFNKDSKVNTAIRNTFDGWQNIIKGIRTGRDSASNYRYTRQFFSQETLDAIYEGDPVAAKIIDILPNSMTKDCIDIYHEKSKEIKSEYDRLNLFQNMNQAIKLRNVHGGSAILLNLDDGNTSLSDPVIPEKVKSIISAELIFDRWEIYPVRENRYKKPEFYWLPSDLLPDSNKFGNNKIHRSRLLIFDGVDTGRRNRDLNDGWGTSQLSRIYEAVKSFSTGNQRLLTILDEYIYPIFKLDGLNDKLLDNCDTQVISKLETMMLVKSILNALVLDKNDDFEQRTINLSGLDKIMSELKEYLAAVTDIPVTLLLNQNPQASMAEGGTSQRKDWADKVRYNQEMLLTPAIDKINEYLKPSLQIPQDEIINYSYPDILYPTQKEQSEIRKNLADADTKNIEMGIYSASEARTRYQDNNVNMNITLDESAIIDINQALEDFDDE